MYIVAELDGSVFNRPIAVFHVIPYFMWTMISLPPLDNLLDISQTQLHEMKDSYIAAQMKMKKTKQSHYQMTEDSHN